LTIPTPCFTDRAKFGVQVRWCTQLDRCMLSSLKGENHKSWLYFQIQHYVTAPSNGPETKLSAGAQLQTFPLSFDTKPNRFYDSNALIAKSLVQTVLFKSVTDKNHRTFATPRGTMSQPHQTHHGDKGGPYQWGEIWRERVDLQGKFHPHRCNLSPMWAKNLKVDPECSIDRLTVMSFRHFIYASCSGRHVVGQGNVNILQHF